MRLLHTMLRVGDLDRSVKFYTEVLKQAVQLAWTQAVDSTGGTGIASYRANRNGTLLGETTSTSIADQAATVGATYTYTVDSVDRVGHVSLTPASTNFTMGTGGGPKRR